MFFFFAFSSDHKHNQSPDPVVPGSCTHYPFRFTGNNFSVRKYLLWELIYMLLVSTLFATFNIVTGNMELALCNNGRHMLLSSRSILLAMNAFFTIRCFPVKMFDTRQLSWLGGWSLLQSTGNQMNIFFFYKWKPNEYLIS